MKSYNPIKTYRLTVETFFYKGRFEHRVSESGVGQDRFGEIGDDVVEALKRANELLHGQMPENSEGLRSTVEYKARRPPIGKTSIG
jgi:hypothetical protein